MIAKFLLPGVLLLLSLASCSQPEKTETEAATPVQTARAQRAPITRIFKAPAILYPVNQAGIMSKISSPIRAFYVNRGDPVHQGQLLAQLEDRDLNAAALEAKGQLDQAEANYRSLAAAALPDELVKSQSEVQSGKEALAAARQTYESRKTLYEEGALPRKQLDEASVSLVQARSGYEVALKHLESLQKIGKEEQIKTAQAQIESARGRWQAAQAQVEYAKITSPISGVVTDRPLYAGEMANSGSPLLTVMDISQMIARANLPADELDRIRMGSKALLKTSDDSRQLEGKVTVVSPALDPNSTTAEVWILVPNKEKRLKPGTSVAVAIEAETVQDAVVVPALALLSAAPGSGYKLFVVADSKARERLVEVGIRTGEKAQIISGLQPGEIVVTAGVLGLKDQSEVKIEPSEKSVSHDEAKPGK